MTRSPSEQPPAPLQDKPTKIITSAEVQQNRWCSIDGQVYDIQAFLDLHPGGRKILMPYLGRDASKAFRSEKIHVHSTRAFNILQSYHIGSLQGGDSSASESYSHPLSKLVDFAQPVLPQVMTMDPKLYRQWLHGASIGSSTFRIFQTDFFEQMSRYPWWYILPLWLPVICLLAWNSMQKSSVIATVASLPLGLLVWGFLEYLLHRFVFHMESDTTHGNFFHFFAHGIHHIIPLDPTRLTFPPSFAIPLVYCVYMAVASATQILPFLEGVMAGALFGYVSYDTMHYYFHHGERFRWSRYFSYMKKRHTDHHYKCPEQNFGVTSPLFDWVFGTSQ